MRDWTIGTDSDKALIDPNNSLTRQLFGQHQIDIVARTLYGECRGEPYLGQVAVAWVIRNRADADLGKDGKPDWWGETPAGVCLAYKQFSCWWDNQRPILQTLGSLNPTFVKMKTIAQGVLSGTIPDPTYGATHYHTIKDPGRLVAPQGWPPAWAKTLKPTVKIFSHQFLK